jgi:hypothetical protein
VKVEHFYGHPEDCLAQWPIDYYTWVTLHEGRVIVIDSGFTLHPRNSRKRDARPYLATSVELL